ncbi:MAG: electron transport complex subunit RsxC [Spirochaeta sp. LUC14_002_19_P3]|nr:MAG: electron transport complex subunit RsxC [Spirochaeta sp. LUC14_002_19_P3]
MIKMKTFSRGGVHPRDFKELTAACPIRSAPLPTMALVPFLQHIGAPLLPKVAVGDFVKEGQMIAESNSFVSAAVHSPVPGEVKDLKTIYLASGMKSTAALIEMSGDFTLTGKPVQHRQWEELSNEEILKILKDYGVVGQGGAAFPSHVKYTIPKGRNFEVFIINAAECEPYLTADHRVILERRDDLLEGLRIIRRLLNPKRIVFGLESNKMEAYKLLQEVSKEHNFEVMLLQKKYPQGAEKNLIEAILGREVPSGKLPIEVGVINANVGTIVSVCHAVRDDRPVIDRVITISGGAIKHPGNLLARIGTPIRSLIEECGGFTEEPAKLISGGPMMGFTFYNLDTPVTKGTSGILAFTAREAHYFSQTACLSCGRCAEACPMGLSPTAIFKYIDNERLDDAAKAGLDDCILCGACAFSCPAHIPLVSAMKAARGRRRRLAVARKDKG